MTVLNTQNEVLSELGLTQPSQKAKSKNDPNDMGLQDFLNLMITQLNNQDPFEPMDNGEFLGQIAQFGSVSGLNQLNESFSTLSASMTSGQALQAGSLVGREVLVPTDAGYLAAGGQVKGRVTQDVHSAATTLSVYDQYGQLIREVSMGPQPAGEVNFSWDGMTDKGVYADPGIYRFRVSSNQGGQEGDLQTNLFSKVDSVNIGGADGLTVNLAGLGPVAFNNVKQIH